MDGPWSQYAPSTAPESQSSPAAAPVGPWTQYAARTPESAAPSPAPAPQSLAGAGVNALAQGAVSGTGAVIAGAGRQAMAYGVRGTQQQLAAMDAIDAGKDVPQDQDIIGYQSFSPEQKAQARADFTAASAELAKREPNAAVQAGTAIEGAAPQLFPVDPAQEGHLTSAARMVGSVGPTLLATAAGTVLGGPTGGVLASAAAVGAQAYDGTYQEAIDKGATPAQADDAAGKAAYGQVLAMSLPIAKVIPLIPVPLREGFVKTAINLAQNGVELGGGNMVGTLAQNYVAQQTYDPNRPLVKGTGDAGIDGFLASLAIRGAGQAFGAARAGITEALEPRPTIADIGAAPDIDSAIAAAGKVAQAPPGEAATAPAGWNIDDRFGQAQGSQAGPVTTAAPNGAESTSTGWGDLFAQRPANPGPAPAAGMDAHDAEAAAAGWRRLGPDEPRTVGQAIATDPRTGREYVQDTPVPQSVGAAASRDMTMPGTIPPETPAQRATAMQKMVNQSAEDRLTPQGRDDEVYVPGVQRPEAMRDFSPAAEGEMSSALQHKVLYNTDSNYHDQFDAQVKANNDVMVDRLHGLFGDANARDAAMEEAKELMPGSVNLFAGEQPVNAQPIVDQINQILGSQAGKRDAVESTLSRILPKLYDADGNLETLPSMLKGIRDDITDKLYDKTPTAEGNAARTARNQLRDVLSVVDNTIGSGLPGTKYQDYLTNLSAALGKVSKLDYLQKYLTGPKKLTDLAGNLQFGKVQKMLEDIQVHHADQTGGAKELSWDEINQIEAVRNELAAKDLLDRRASVRGSPTAQITNATGVLGSGPLGAGVKGAAEMALHAGLAATTHGVGNAALGAYRLIARPAMQAARAQQQAAALAVTKQRLLATTPRWLGPQAGP